MKNANDFHNVEVTGKMGKTICINNTGGIVMLKKETVELLDSIVVDFFPKEGNWKSNCFRKEEVVSEKNLPCHLRDSNWLASLMMKKYDLSSLGEGVVREYVKESGYFHQLRKEYEVKIVKWQINWMRNDGANWIVDAKYGEEFYFFHPMCDYAFRRGIVDTLLAIGMDIEAIEEGIEKNVDMWLDTYMNLAFNNQYNPVFTRFRIGNSEEKEEETLSEVDPNFKECWLAYRKYQYYQEHRESVDAFGTVTKEMQMTLEEVEKLKAYLQEQEALRIKEIEEFKNRKTNQELPVLKEMPESDFYGLSFEDCLPKKQEEGKGIAKRLRRALEKRNRKSN